MTEKMPVLRNPMLHRRSVLKALGAIPAAGLGAGLLTGCLPGGSGTEEQKLAPTPSAEASGSITLWMRDDDLLKVFKTVIPAFNKKYPKVTVSMVGVDIATKLPPTLISGTGVPDGSFYEDVNIGAQAAHLYDLTDLMAPHRSDTVEFKLDVLTFDDKLVGVPWDTCPGLLYYRTDVLSDAGVKPESITSYDALLDAARAIKKKNPDAAPIPLEQDANLGMQWLMMLINQQQGTGLVGADGKLTIDTDAYRTALTWIKTVADEKLGARSKFASTAHVAQLDNGTISLVPWAIWFNFLPQSGLKKTVGSWRVPGPSLLHIACHGRYRPANPLFSALRLADRWVTSAEVLELDLRGSLVTLSACESGRHGGDAAEPVGLAWAFLAAGAAGAVVSQWVAHDAATTHLMSAFYGHLTAGLPPAHALRAAQLATARRWPHPFYWAPFSHVASPVREGSPA